MNIAEKLRKAKELYDSGDYQGAIDATPKPDLVGRDKFEEEDLVEALRLLAWAYYYQAIKGVKGEDKDIVEGKKAARAAISVSYGLDTIEYRGRQPDKALSAYNVLPLAYWINGNQQQAWRYSDEAVAKFKDEPSVWNTRGILMKWAKKFEDSLAVFDKVSETALAAADFRTAGHGQQNKGDSLRDLHRNDEAREAYQGALRLYEHFESKGNKATAHIDSTKKKIAQLL